MPNRAISELTEVTTPSADDALAIVNNLSTKKVTVANLLLNSHTFTAASSLVLSAGGTTSVLSDLQALLDGNVYHVDEVAASPGYNLTLTFLNISNIDHIVIRFYYAGGSTHGCRIQLYNVLTTNWDTFWTELGADVDFSLKTIFLPDYTNYITGGQVQLRFYHSEVGNPAHDLYVDYVGIGSV